MSRTITLNDEQLAGLRELRRYCWRQVLRASATREYYDKRLDAGARLSNMERRDINIAYSRHTWYMAKVQLLNDFFEIGDTAEKDEREAHAARGAV